MSGAPIKRARREIAEQAVLRAAHEALVLSREEIDKAILRGWEEGGDPVLLLMPVARALVGKALGGDVVAVKEVFERVSGKVVQEVGVDVMEGVPGVTITIMATPTLLEEDVGVVGLVEGPEVPEVPEVPAK